MSNTIGSVLFKALVRQEDWSALPDESKETYEKAGNDVVNSILFSGPEVLPLLLTAVKSNLQKEPRKSRYLSLVYTAAEECENWLSRFLRESMEIAREEAKKEAEQPSVEKAASAE